VANDDTCPRCGRPAFVQFFVDQEPVLGRYEHLDCPECDDTTDEPLEVSVVDRTEPDQWHLADLHEACWENAKLKAAVYAKAVEEEGPDGVIKPPHIWSLDA
jgi:hypothetical protein